jgi:hypothetical protein
MWMGFRLGGCMSGLSLSMSQHADAYRYFTLGAGRTVSNCGARFGGTIGNRLLLRLLRSRMGYMGLCGLGWLFMDNVSGGRSV